MSYVKIVGIDSIHLFLKIKNIVRVRGRGKSGTSIFGLPSSNRLFFKIRTSMRMEFETRALRVIIGRLVTLYIVYGMYGKVYGITT